MGPGGQIRCQADRNDEERRLLQHSSPSKTSDHLLQFELHVSDISTWWSIHRYLIQNHHSPIVILDCSVNPTGGGGGGSDHGEHKDRERWRRPLSAMHLLALARRGMTNVIIIVYIDWINQDIRYIDWTGVMLLKPIRYIAWTGTRITGTTCSIMTSVLTCLTWWLSWRPNWIKPRAITRRWFYWRTIRRHPGTTCSGQPTSTRRSFSTTATSLFCKCPGISTVTNSNWWVRNSDWWVHNSNWWVHNSNWSVYNSNWWVHNSNWWVHNSNWSVHNSNWSVHNSNWSVHNSNWSVHNSNWWVHNSNWSVHNSNWSVHNSNWWVHNSNWSVHNSNWWVHNSNWSVHNSNWWVHNSNGWVYNSNCAGWVRNSNCWVY